MKKVLSVCVTLLFVVLLVMGAGCVGDNTQAQTNQTGATVVPTQTGTAGPAATTTATIAPTMSADGPVYNVSGASVVLVDALAGKSGVNGLSAAANTSGTLALTASAGTGQSVTVGSDAVPVYSAMDIADKNGNFAGLITLNFVVPAAFVEEKTNGDPTQIVMVHSEGGIWKPLDTFYLGTNKTAGEYYYASMTKSFSPFAICSLSDADVAMTVYDLTQVGSYPEFIGDVNGAAKTQRILKNALNTVLTELSTNEEATVDDCLENAIEDARSTVEDVKLTPYNDESGSSSSSSPTHGAVKNEGGKVMLLVPLEGTSCFVGITSSSASAGTLTVNNVQTASEENPIEDIEVSGSIDAEVYQKMDISASGLDGNVFLSFTVPTKVLTENNWNPEDVAMLHQMSNGQWEILPTSYDPDTKIFKARAPATYSPFAVAKVGARNINEDLGNLEMTVLRFASPEPVTARVVDDYYLDKIMKVTNPPLVHQDFNGEMVPCLAKTCDMDSKDNTTWTVTLDDAYVWSDNGQPVTSDDVIFTLTKYGFVNAELSSSIVRSMEASDDKRSVTFNLIKGDDKFYQRLANANIYPKHFWEGKDFTTYSSTTFIGCGPYYVKSIDLNSAVVTLARNPFWAGDDAYYDKVEVHWFENTEALNAAMKRGEADAYWAYGTLSYANVRSMIEGNTGLTYETYSGFAPFSYMSFNMADETSPAYNRTFREAVSYALDYNYMIDALFKGDGDVGDRGLIPHTLGTYPDDAKDYEPLTYNPTKAAELLAQANFTDVDNDGKLEWNGNDVKIRVLGGGNSGFRHDASILVATYLENLGLDVALDDSPSTTPAEANLTSSWFYKKWAYEYEVTFNAGNAVGMKAGAGIGDGSFLYSERPVTSDAGAFGLLNNIKDPYFQQLSDAKDYNGILDYYANNVTSLPLKWAKGEYVVYSRSIDGWDAVANQKLLCIPCLLNVEPV